MVEMKVMVFGTYDIFHKGHEYFLNKASEYGKLVIVLARDETVKEIKGKPLNSEENRKRYLEASGYEVYLGGLGDKMEIVRKINPDLICLGYDQDSFGVEKEFEVVRIEGFEVEKYKSSLLRKK